MKFGKEIKTGIVVTVVIVLFLIGYNFLKGRNLFSSYNFYFIEVNNAAGLQKSSPIDINGFNVGLVNDIRFKSKRLDTLLVELAIKKDFSLPLNSLIEIGSAPLGGRFITVFPGDSAVIAKSKDMFKRVKIAPNIIAEIKDKATGTMDSVNMTLRAVQQTLDSATQQNIRLLVANLEQMVANERSKISLILNNFSSFSGNLKQNNEEISKLIANLNKFSENLASSDVKTTLDKANSALTQLNTVVSGINNGEGTLGQLVRNDSVYQVLQQSLTDLDKLLIDLRENPGEYVHFSLFGKKKKN